MIILWLALAGYAGFLLGLFLAKRLERLGDQP